MSDFTRRGFVGSMLAALGISYVLPAKAVAAPIPVVPPPMVPLTIPTIDFTLRSAVQPGFIGSQLHKEWMDRMTKHFGPDWHKDDNFLRHPETQKPKEGLKTFLVFYLDVDYEPKADYSYNDKWHRGVDY